MRATAIFPFAASRILFNEGEGREEEEKALVFRRPGSFFPLAAAGQDIRPRRKGAEEEGGGRTRDSTRIDTISLSLSLLLLSFSSSPRIEGCTLRCVFQLLGSSNLRGGGKGTVTSRSYRVSSVSWSWGGRCFVRGERGERERNSRRPGQRFRSTVGLFTGLFSRSLCYFI